MCVSSCPADVVVSVPRRRLCHLGKMVRDAMVQEHHWVPPHRQGERQFVHELQGVCNPVLHGPEDPMAI